MLRDWRENTAITALVTLTVLLVVYGPQFAYIELFRNLSGPEWAGGFAALAEGWGTLPLLTV